MLFDVEDVVGSILKSILLNVCFWNNCVKHVQDKVTPNERNGISICSSNLASALMVI